MLLHREDQTFLRDREEGLVEAASVNCRPFNQCGDFREKRFEITEAGGASSGLELVANLRCPLFEGGNYRTFGFEHPRIFVCLRDADLALRQKAVAAGHVACREPEHLARHDLRTM